VSKQAALTSPWLPLCYNQSFIGSAPAIIVACVPETKGYNRDGWMQRYSSLVDASIALEHLSWPPGLRD
jgi:hypothetical protein